LSQSQLHLCMPADMLTEVNTLAEYYCLSGVRVIELSAVSESSVL